MTQAELNRAVAQATGESLATVRQRGFFLADIGPLEDQSTDDEPHVFDWDTRTATPWKSLVEDCRVESS